MTTLLVAVTVGRGPACADTIDYSRSVQPLLAEFCYDCHGPDAATRKAGLRLDHRSVATAPLPSGKTAIVPGRLKSSELVRRLFAGGGEDVMPPPDFRRQPTTKERDVLRRWVEQGAPYDQHWAFTPPTKGPVPNVQDDSWPVHAIDRFVLARLEAAGLAPSAEADRTTLIRRISLDLRGLPPSIDELQRLAGAPWSVVVEHMLQSVHHGERMAQDWLDLARYGDTNGYHSDSDRSMWLYRDYVIDAFNDNTPFDQFVVENLAGDLLPAATQRTRIASGFNRCVTFNEEGGADPDEFYVTYAVDRANTTGQVFLGLTVGCAQCHDHKYDPITQKEYYQLYAFFNSVEGEIGAGGMSGYHNKPLPPLLKVTTDDQKKQLAQLAHDIAVAQGELEEIKQRSEFRDSGGALAGEAEAWAASIAAPTGTSFPIKQGLRLHLRAEDITIADGAAVERWNDASGRNQNAFPHGRPTLARRGLNSRPAVRLDGDHDYLRTRGGAEHLAADFTMVVVLSFHDMQRHQMALMWGDESQGKRRALWKTDKNRLAFNGYGADAIGTSAFALNSPAVAVVRKRGSDNRTSFTLDGKPSGAGNVALSEYENESITIGANNAGGEKTAALIAEVLVYNRALHDEEEATIGRYLGAKYGITTAYEAAPAAVLDIARKRPEAWTNKERDTLFAHFIRHVHPRSRDLIANAEARIAELEGKRTALERETPTTMVMVEMEKRKPAFVLERGDFQRPAESVQPDVPAALPPFPKNTPRNRLGLARWLTEPGHPLLARVTVNRIWKQLFGRGLVGTAGDFGTQGERPSHPELLDWLAVDFVEHGWDIRRLIRVITHTATYRQQARFHADGQAVDPLNRLLWRAPRFRLSAENVRDTALSISGLLHTKVGGPSVMPYQPPEYLQSIGKKWRESTGPSRYRRGLYTFWRRTMLYPAFQIFDAPSREFCTVDRPRTNTPLQSLVTLNDPTFVAAARAFGTRIRGHQGDDDARLKFAFRVATARHPTAPELAQLRSSLAEQRAAFASDVDAARAFLAEAATGGDDQLTEAAAWTSVGSILLNLDETITRE